MQRVVLAVAALLSVLAIAVSIAAVVLVQTGHKAMVMHTDSMEPTINRGDIVVVEQRNPSDLEVGDIIAFTAPIGTPSLVTHRIAEVEERQDGPAFVTRGDSNASTDPWLFQYDDGAWKLAFTIPWLGHLAAVPHTVAARVAGGVAVFFTSLVLLWPVFVPNNVPERADLRRTTALPDLLSHATRTFPDRSQSLEARLPGSSGPTPARRNRSSHALKPLLVKPSENRSESGAES